MKHMTAALKIVAGEADCASKRTQAGVYMKLAQTPNYRFDGNLPIREALKALAPAKGETMLGKFLKETPKQVGARGAPGGGTRGSRKVLRVTQPTLADLGLTTKESAEGKFKRFMGRIAGMGGAARPRPVACDYVARNANQARLTRPPGRGRMQAL